MFRLYKEDYINQAISAFERSQNFQTEKIALPRNVFSRGSKILEGVQLFVSPPTPKRDFAEFMAFYRLVLASASEFSFDNLDDSIGAPSLKKRLRTGLRVEAEETDPEADLIYGQLDFKEVIPPDDALQRLSASKRAQPTIETYWRSSSILIYPDVNLAQIAKMAEMGEKPSSYVFRLHSPYYQQWRQAADIKTLLT